MISCSARSCEEGMKENWRRGGQSRDMLDERIWKGKHAKHHSMLLSIRNVLSSSSWTMIEKGMGEKTTDHIWDPISNFETVRTGFTNHFTLCHMNLIWERKDRKWKVRDKRISSSISKAKRAIDLKVEKKKKKIEKQGSKKDGTWFPALPLTSNRTWCKALREASSNFGFERSGDWSGREESPSWEDWKMKSS